MTSDVTAARRAESVTPAPHVRPGVASRVQGFDVTVDPSPADDRMVLSTAGVASGGAPPGLPLLIGERHVVLDHLGEGATAIVYSAYDRNSIDGSR